MDFELKQASLNELDEALDMLKEAAKSLQSRKINQWEFWLNPPKEKINWVKEGFLNREFYFITQSAEVVGMLRLLDKDHLYWGEELEEAKYIHSLVIKEKYAGKKIGEKVIEIISENALKNSIHILRLDCNAANSKLCNYYEKQGFVKVREKRMPHSLNNLYEKRLN